MMQVSQFLPRLFFIAVVLSLLLSCTQRGGQTTAGRIAVKPETPLAVTVVAAGGEQGYHKYLGITPDSVDYQWMVAAEQVQGEYRRATAAGLWDSLMQDISLPDFRQVESSPSVRPVDGVDVTYTIYTDGDTISFMNPKPADPRYGTLKRFFDRLAEVEYGLKALAQPERIPLPGEETPPRILLPATYRIHGANDPTEGLTGQWLALCRNDDGGYAVRPAVYSITVGMDECSGDTTKTIQAGAETVVFFENNGYRVGGITGYALLRHAIGPAEKPMNIILYGSTSYMALRAEADTSRAERGTSPAGDTVWYGLRDYKLFIKPENGPEQLLFEQAAFVDTFPEITFASDINGDGFPDLVIHAPRHYEETRVLLLMSSGSAAGKYRLSEVAIAFDC